MQIQITPNQCYCSFDDGIVYEFVSDDDVPFSNSCNNCSFRWHFPFLAGSKRCFSVPCQMNNRMDKKNGFWRISKTIDYQQFTKMLKNGG